MTIQIDPKTNHYIKFIIAQNEIKNRKEFPILGVNEEELFETILLKAQQTSFCKVSDILNSVAEASISATHRRLKKLKLLGYIKLTMDELDNRVKYVNFTPMAISYIGLINSQFDALILPII
jgi:DNA-binding MarR family transcriptional regulator